MKKKIDVFEHSLKPHIGGIIKAMVVGVLVLAQIVFIVSVSLMLQKYTLTFYLLFEIASMIVIFSLINQHKCTSFKIAWVSIVLLLPLTGHIMYIMWGAPNRHKKITDQIMDKINNGYKYNWDDTENKKIFYRMYPNQRRISDYMSAEKFPLFKNNQISYFPMGEDVFTAMLEDFRKAEKFIFIDFFIVAEGLLWDKVRDLLYDKVKEGVEVKFLYDDFGAMFRTPNDFKEQLQKNGIEVRVFNQIYKYIDKLYLNYRSHQKIVVIDGNIGYTGGMNLADEYANLCERFGRWKDTGIRIEGDAVWGLTISFLQMWDVSLGRKKGINYEKYMPSKQFPKNNSFCHVISDGPANDPENPIVNIYMQMISYSNRYLYITTPYLIIEEEMRFELIRAAKSGIDVRIITPSIPDKKHVKLLTEYNYGILLKEGIRIFEYVPGFIHAKMILNENSAIVGTINMDYRSFYLHYECGAWICDPDLVKEIRTDVIDTIKNSIEITYEEWKKRPWYIKAYQMVINLFQTLI